jgi:Fe-S-cluster containining protein
MNESIDYRCLPANGHRVFLQRLDSLFARMEEAYQQAADYYGFLCQGCEDNCCQTRFYHHTLIENLYMADGFRTLGQTVRRTIKKKAAWVCRETAVADEKMQRLRIMCPANSDGRCQLYAFRPMICRLHGLPHELRRPGQNTVFGPGCDQFDRQCKGKPYYRFDRTPFYFEMARLEQELKKATGFCGKVKMTVAEMVINFTI